MKQALREWLTRPWRPQESRTLADSYRAMFATEHGQRVLAHLMDNVYCTVYEGTDAQACVAHNARRSVVHDILVTLDAVENPRKYALTVEEYDGLAR